MYPFFRTRTVKWPHGSSLPERNVTNLHTYQKFYQWKYNYLNAWHSLAFLCSHCWPRLTQIHNHFSGYSWKRCQTFREWQNSTQGQIRWRAKMTSNLSQSGSCPKTSSVISSTLVSEVVRSCLQQITSLLSLGSHNSALAFSFHWWAAGVGPVRVSTMQSLPNRRCWFHSTNGFGERKKL